MNRLSPVATGSVIASIALYCWMAFGQNRADFGLLMLSVSLLFALWLVLIRKRSYSFRTILILALLFRLPFLAHEPALSDDVWRFIWDGQLVLNGENPYTSPPSALMEANPVPDEALNDLYSRLNSPDYYSVYPPFNQFVFAALAFLGKHLGHIPVYHVFFLLIELLGLYWMYLAFQLLGLPLRRLTWWAWNPLVIMEVSANLHFEGLVWTLLMGGLVLFLKHKTLGAGGMFGLAIATKLVPLIYLPLVLRKQNRKYLLYAVAACLLTPLLFLPFVSASLIDSYSQSLDLFFRKFEFNASFYYLFREIGLGVKGYNLIAWIGPAMAIGVFAGAMWLALGRKQASDHRTFFRDVLLIHTLFLLLSTTVHPWYVLLPLGLACFAGLRYPLVWSYAVWLSYSHYMNNGNEEHYLFIALEYVLLGMAMVWDYRRESVSKLALDQ